MVTTGLAVDPGAVDPRPNVEVVSHRPHSEVLTAASLVVTHAGHGTVMAALTHGVPLVCVPVGRDQHDNAARVVAVGAGVRVRRRDAAAVAAAINRVLGDHRYRLVAERMAGILRLEPSAHGAVDEIEAAATPPA